MSELTPRPAPARALTEEDRAFLATYEPSVFPRPSVAVDIVLLTVEDRKVRVLLVQRTEPPYRTLWSIPGGFLRVELKESLHDAATRVLAEKAGCTGVWLEQLATFGEPGRDPRDRVLSVAYMGLVDLERYRGSTSQTPASLTADVDCVPYDEDVADRLHAPPVTLRNPAGEHLDLAFDHQHIVATAMHRLRGKLNYAPVGYQLLPAEFTLRELQDVHEAILGLSLNKDSFRRRILASGDLEDLKRKEEAVGHRPARLYRFRETR